MSQPQSNNCLERMERTIASTIIENRLIHNKALHKLQNHVVYYVQIVLLTHHHQRHCYLGFFFGWLHEYRNHNNS